MSDAYVARLCCTGAEFHLPNISRGATHLRIPCGGSLDIRLVPHPLKRHLPTDFRLVARIVTYDFRMGMRQHHVHVDGACCKALGLFDASKLLVGNGGTRIGRIGLRVLFCIQENQ